MDDNTMAVSVAAILVSGFVLSVLLFHVGRAWAERIRHKGGQPLPAGPEQDVLASDLQQMRRELAELSERVDFTERLLAKQREGERLAPPH